MLAHLLEQAGIQAHIHGEALQGAVGELPAGGLIQLMVAEDHYDKARQLILKWEKTSVLEDAESPRPGGRFRIVAAIVFMAVGVFTGWALKTALDNSQFTVGASSTGFDQNGDGKDDVTWLYSFGSNVVRRVETDSNFDGRVDAITRYDGFATPIAEELDMDFDGVFETRDDFKDGVRSRGEVDTDRNEVADLIQVFEHGVLAREELTDHQYGFVVRINHYEANRLRRSESDLDRDGFLETVRTYDRFGEISDTETRPQP